MAFDERPERSEQTVHLTYGGRASRKASRVNVPRQECWVCERSSQEMTMVQHSEERRTRAEVRDDVSTSNRTNMEICPVWGSPGAVGLPA